MGIPDEDLQILGSDLVPAVLAAGARADILVLLPSSEQPEVAGAHDRWSDGAGLPGGLPVCAACFRLRRGALDRAALHSVAALIGVDICDQAFDGGPLASCFLRQLGLDALLRVRIHCTAPVKVRIAFGLSIQSTRAALEDSRSSPAQCQVEVKDTIVLDFCSPCKQSR